MGASSSIISNAIPSYLPEHEKLQIAKALEKRLVTLQCEGNTEKYIQDDLKEQLERKLDEAKKRADEDTASVRSKPSIRSRAKSVNFTISDTPAINFDSNKSAFTDETAADGHLQAEIAHAFDEKVDIDDVVRNNALRNRTKSRDKSRRWSSVTFQGEIPNNDGRKKSTIRKMSVAFMKHADTFVTAEYVEDTNIERHKSVHAGTSFSLGSTKNGNMTIIDDEEDSRAAKSLAATVAVMKSIGKLTKTHSKQAMHSEMKSNSDANADDSVYNIVPEAPTQSNHSSNTDGNVFYPESVSRPDHTVQSPSVLTSQISNNLALELLDAQMDVINKFMSQHRADMATEVEGPHIFDVYSNPFRVRRLTFEQAIVHDDHNKIDTEIVAKKPKSEPLATKLNVYAASELDDYVHLGLSNGEGENIESVNSAPFPEEYVGTFSCHGMEPKTSTEGCDDQHLCGKINQDRGCVVYPLRYEYQEAPNDHKKATGKRRNSVAVATEDYLFMVLDGHGGHGALVSEFAMRHIVLSLPRHPLLFTDPPTALTECIVSAHESLFNSDINCVTSGTTCVLVYMSKNKLYVANVGDSRAVMGMYLPDDADAVQANLGDEEDYLAIDSMDLTTDHKPDEPQERERILRCGGFIKPARFGQSARVYLNKEMTMIGIATSRTIGDFAVKSVGVVAEPEIFEYTITPQHKFMILASDGVWEFLTSQEACDIVNMFIEEGATAACQELIAAAMSKWESLEGDYRDDITAIVVSLPLPGSAQL